MERADGRADQTAAGHEDLSVVQGAGQLRGTTEERQQMYRDRFARADQPQIVNYEPWSTPT